MSSSRDDFGIAFRSALLQRGAAQKFSIFSLLFLAIIVFFLDVYGFKFMKPVRSVINDAVYRVSLVASSPSRFVPKATGGFASFLSVKKENERLKQELEAFKQKELNVEFLSNQNKNLKKILESEESFLKKESMILSKVLIDKSSPYLKSIIINRGSKSGILKGMPVLDKEYLVGRVVETNYLSSRVLLLNDLNSRIPVTFGDEGTQAILKGIGKNQPVLEYLPEGYVVEGGVDVFTSGKDGIFFPGSPIGITAEDGRVKLFSEASQLSFVKVDVTKQLEEDF
ncbi:MAG: rod shape-determining protein MreC [Candidatus Pelagibacter sp. TMED263]|nr:MAG: rod shape-determining protein MreC [Candidatus Pelagibacter sp. TMED263]|tara:strand:+ start:339 stop:1187 length:849 start_codon:yes stop_codon:yes gene_type:complete